MRALCLGLLVGVPLAGTLAYSLGHPVAVLSARLDEPTAAAISVSEPASAFAPQEYADVRQEARLRRVRAEAVRSASKWAARQVK